MFAKSSRCQYQSNQLADVICQLRFPEILSIRTELPAKFQDAIRSEFPKYAVKQEAQPPKLTGKAGEFSIQQQPSISNYQFTSEDNKWRVNLTSNFISLSCNQYSRWEDFAKILDKPLAAFIQVYKPAYFERVGLRYINLISRKALSLEDYPFRELFQPQYLGVLGDDEILEQQTTHSGVDAELSIPGGCRVKIHAGPGLVKRGGQTDNEVKFIFDQDLYMPGNVPVNYAAGALQTLHAQAYPIFRGAITDILHESMEPENI